MIGYWQMFNWVCIEVALNKKKTTDCVKKFLTWSGGKSGEDNKAG